MPVAANWQVTYRPTFLHGRPDKGITYVLFAMQWLLVNKAFSFIDQSAAFSLFSPRTTIACAWGSVNAWIVCKATTFKLPPIDQMVSPIDLCVGTHLDLVSAGPAYIQGLYSLNRRTSHRKVSRPRDLGLNFSNRSEIWLAPLQQCCQVSEWLSSTAFSDSGHRGLCNPYKMCNHDLYIRIFIFPHIDNTQICRSHST